MSAVDKAFALRQLADEVARELEAASVSGAMTFEEFAAVLGENWLGWLPDNEGRKPSDFETTADQYADFTRALASYRKNGDPNWRAFREETTDGST